MKWGLRAVLGILAIIVVSGCVIESDGNEGIGDNQTSVINTSCEPDYREITGSEIPEEHHDELFQASPKDACKLGCFYSLNTTSYKLTEAASSSNIDGYFVESKCYCDINNCGDEIYTPVTRPWA